MSQRFTDRRIIITGGASGIGRATAHRFALEGGKIVIGDIDAKNGQAVAREIGGDFVHYDAAQPDAAAHLVSRAVEILGGVDVLLNVAGIMTWGRIEELSAAAWQRTIDINLNAVFYLTQQALPHLIASKGNIVNVASAGGLSPVYGTSSYGVAKAGVVAFTRATALEAARHGVRANAVAPGGVATPMHEKTIAAADFDMTILEEAGARNMPKLEGFQVCEPEDIASAIAYLASDEARYVTGITLLADGGQLCG